MKKINILAPNPPAFLDPLTDLDTCYYYSVPRFFDIHHPNTRWLLTMIKNREDDRLRKKMEISPTFFKGKYFQMLDDPQYYMEEDPSASPMYRKQAILYLTPLGMAIYLNSTNLTRFFLNYTDNYGNRLIDTNETQYASHLQDLKFGDFNAFPPFLIMLRRNSLECAPILIDYGWKPEQNVAMPMRRRFERRVFFYHDWLEIALSILASRPLYPLSSLVHFLTTTVQYNFLKLPMKFLKPTNPVETVKTGLIDVDELPAGTKMLGVKSLMELVEDYDKYLQMQTAAAEIEKVKNEAMALGLNPEIIMMQAQDYDAGYIDQKEKQTETENDNNMWNSNKHNAFNSSNLSSSVQSNTWTSTLNRSRSSTCNKSVPSVLSSYCPYSITAGGNNNAKESRSSTVGSRAKHSSKNNSTNVTQNEAEKRNKNTNAKKKKEANEDNYASEPLRVLLYAHDKDKIGKSLQQCLDTVQVYIKRGYFFNAIPLAAENVRSRDTRNIVILILNLIQREQDKVDTIVRKIKSGYKKFQHIEEHKQLENRKKACLLNMNKMIGILSNVLLHSKEMLAFIKSNAFPPYESEMVDYEVNKYVSQKMEEIKFGIIREFNSKKEAWTYCTRDQLKEINNMKSMQLHFQVGKKPKPEEVKKELDEREKIRKKKASKNKNNMINTNNCYVTYTKVRMKKKENLINQHNEGLKINTLNSLTNMTSLDIQPLDNNAEIDDVELTIEDVKVNNLEDNLDETAQDEDTESFSKWKQGKQMCGGGDEASLVPEMFITENNKERINLNSDQDMVYESQADLATIEPLEDEKEGSYLATGSLDTFIAENDMPTDTDQCFTTESFKEILNQPPRKQKRKNSFFKKLRKNLNINKTSAASSNKMMRLK